MLCQCFARRVTVKKNSTAFRILSRDTVLQTATILTSFFLAARALSGAPFDLYVKRDKEGEEVEERAAAPKLPGFAQQGTS